MTSGVHPYLYGSARFRAHGLAGRLGVAVAGDVPDSTTPQLEDEPRDRVDIHAASSADSPYLPDHGNELAAVMKLERIDLVDLPVVLYVAHKAPDALVSSIDDALELRPKRKPLAVRGGQADQLVDITRVERFEGAPDDVHVPLRHLYSRSPTASSASFRST
jgi:hypothetical protein